MGKKIEAKMKFKIVIYITKYKQMTYREECIRVETENRSEIKAMETE